MSCRKGLLIWMLLSFLCGQCEGATPAASNTLRIVTIEEPPYVHVSNGTSPEYTGFLPDLVALLAQRVGFQYEWYLVPDGKYGSSDLDGSWTGMIGEITRREADMAAAPMTITSTRQRVVDFLMPFQHGGLVLVTKKAPLQTRPYSFSLFQPFTFGLWAALAIVCLLVAVVMGVLGRFDPYERQRGPERDAKTNLSWSQSFWFVFSTVSLQGYERGPRSAAAQTLASFWFGFVMLAVLTYLSGLTNLLSWATVVEHRAEQSVGSLQDVVQARFKDVKIGCLRGGSTYTYFKESRVSMFVRVYHYWQTEDGQSQLVSSQEEGIERARAGNYVFVMENMAARYLMDQAPCDLTTVGGEFAQRSYGIPVPVGSPLRSRLHLAMLELQEASELDRLEQNWWYQRGECSYRRDTGEESQSRSGTLKTSRPQPVEVSMFWEGLIWIIAGLVITSLVALAEILHYRRKPRGVSNSRESRLVITNSEIQ